MTTSHKCISCEKEETVVPLVSLTFSKIPAWICTQCLPTLIHNPAQLESKFRDMDIENPPKPELN
ncbi:MAG: hypothetical protein H6613_17895 [Ignavibacteriales bacterium]|nr:hypothetical protein [Ignavibacteriota bacterium]MCB9250283.1 hypothetical protein [Ignavibacteriales bacterium]